MESLSAVHAIVARDARRAVRQRSRLIGGLARPFMWLVLVGTGYNAIVRVEGAESYHAFVYPGLIVMAALFGGMLTGISTVYDREFGMLRLMLASPAGAVAVLAGRVASAMLVGTLQGGIVLLGSPLVLSVSVGGMVSAAGVLVLAATVSGVMGLLVAVRLRSVENFAGVINVVLFPVLFLSGALYPTGGMPTWARIGAQLNPVSYSVDLMRRALGQPAEFEVSRCLAVLAGFVVLAFVVSVRLFDPEQRLMRRAGATEGRGDPRS